MNVTTTARHVVLDPEDRRFAQQRLERVARFLRERERNVVEAHVTVTGEKNRSVAEILIRVRRHELMCREEGAEPRAAIELAADGLERQMRRIKDRIAERRKGGRQRTADGAGQPEAPATDEEYDWLIEGALPEE
jgi:ribosomal subunit interface protein